MESLLELNSKGLIPGPAETDQEFFTRIKCLKAIDYQDVISVDEWKTSQKITQDLFDFSPDWVIARYSNKNLLPWEGAAVWIGDHLVVQLKEGFKKGTYLKMYDRDEVLAHEAVHAARMAFKEPRFEEFFAYMTSSKRWRSFIGPFFRTPFETLAFLLVLIACLACITWISDLFFLCPMLMLGAGVVRLLNLRKTFFKALEQCKKLNDRHALPVLFRLTDQEICLFSKASEETMIEYINKQTSLRWKMIRESYLK